MNKQSEQTKDRFHFLDGLRGIASMLIVIHHSFTSNIGKFFQKQHLDFIANTLINFTQSGVALFFVLSGVVLLRPYVRQEKRFQIGRYFIRRIKRIYPPYFIALLVGYGIICLFKSYHTFYSDIWQWVDVSPIAFCQQLFIFNFSGSYYNLAWWSLQIEMLFYFIVPVIVWLFARKTELSLPRIVMTLTAVLIISVWAQFYSTDHLGYMFSLKNVVLTIYRFIDYPVCFLMGIYLAKYDFSKQAGKLFIVTGLLISLAGNYFSFLYSPGYGLFYGGIIIMAFQSQQFRIFLDRPIMIWLGERSYSLFLVHFSIFYLTDYLVAFFVPDRNMAYGMLTRLIGLPLALLGAMLLFNFVERRQARGLVTEKIFWPWQIGQLKSETLEADKIS